MSRLWNYKMNKYQEHSKKIAEVCKLVMDSCKGKPNYHRNVANILDNSLIICVWCGEMVKYRNKAHFRKHYAK